MQVVLAEHLVQVLLRHGGQLAPGQFSDAVEVQQLALREQDQQRADRVMHQNGLHFLCGWQRFVVHDFAVVDGRLAKQLPDDRRGVLGGVDVGNFCHGCIQIPTIAEV